MDKLASLATLTTVDLDGAFKTPTLRNVALTAPYFHTGGLPLNCKTSSIFTIAAAIPRMSFPGTRTTTIKPLNLSDDEKQALIDLLTSLTGTRIPQ